MGVGQVRRWRMGWKDEIGVKGEGGGWGWKVRRSGIK